MMRTTRKTCATSPWKIPKRSILVQEEVLAVALGFLAKLREHKGPPAEARAAVAM
jgi:hypothetical protein